MRNIVATGFAILAGLALAACSGAGGTTGPQALTVEAKEFTFSPANLEVQAGQPVKLTLQNTGTEEHDFSILEIPLAAQAEETGGAEHDMSNMADMPDLHVAAMKGQRATLDFTPTQAGTYQFWCTVPGHKDAGMTGTLVVRGP